MGGAYDEAGYGMSRPRRVALALALLFGTGLGSVAGSAQESAGDWAFTSLPLADLWFHGMALVDPIGPGPIPLYDPGYPSEVRRAKESAGVSGTLLDDRLDLFRRAFRRDASFEVLHFLPLYFPNSGRTEVFAALDLLSGSEGGIPRTRSTNTSFGVEAVGSILTTIDQRRVLGEFVRALEEEWDDFFGAWSSGDAARRRATESAVQASWQQDFRAALAPFLEGIGMDAGVVAMVPAIGVEGRIFGGSPRVSTDNVLVVTAPADPSTATEAVFSMLREISFPLVRRVLDRVDGAVGPRGYDEGRAVRAAVHSGAIVLEAFRPEAVTAYQRYFLSQAGRSAPSGATIGSAFGETYPLDAGLMEALREEILSTKKDGGAG
jgi:hypothetical protein